MIAWHKHILCRIIPLSEKINMLAGPSLGNGQLVLMVSMQISEYLVGLSQGTTT